MCVYIYIYIYIYTNSCTIIRCNEIQICRWYKAATCRSFTTYLYIIVILVQSWFIRIYVVISKNFKNVVVAFYSFWLMLGEGHKLWTLNTWKGSAVPQRLYLHFTLLNFYKANILHLCVIQSVRDLQQLQICYFTPFLFQGNRIWSGVVQCITCAVIMMIHFSR